MTRLAGAHVLVTGGSEGIGFETGRLAAARGASVSLIARRPDVLGAAAAAIRAESPRADVGIATADVADHRALGSAIDECCAARGPVDVLVCCAGYARPGHADELPIEEFRRHMEVNYLGAVHAIRHVMAPMRARRRGHLLVTSSTAGLIGVFGYAAYSPTKFAVRGLAEVLRSELAGSGVRVGVIYPPDTETPGFERENATKPKETVALSGAIAPIRADAMANRIVEGIEADRLQIFADPTTAVLARTAGVLGPVIRRWSDRTTRRA